MKHRFQIIFRDFTKENLLKYKINIRFSWVRWEIVLVTKRICQFSFRWQIKSHLSPTPIVTVRSRMNTNSRVGIYSEGYSYAMWHGYEMIWASGQGADFENDVRVLAAIVVPRKCRFPRFLFRTCRHAKPEQACGHVWVRKCYCKLQVFILTCALCPIARLVCFGMASSNSTFRQEKEKSSCSCLYQWTLNELRSVLFQPCRFCFATLPVGNVGIVLMWVIGWVLELTRRCSLAPLVHPISCQSLYLFAYASRLSLLLTRLSVSTHS